MKKRTLGRLQLHRETIVSLTPERFRLVAGGRIDLSDQNLCNPSLATFCGSCTDNTTTTTIV
jgi:hypothetical protein